MEPHAQQKITMSKHRSYSISSQIFCCKCFNCFKQMIIITSDMRKESIQKLINEYTLHIQQQDLYDPIMLMVLIYLSNEQSTALKHIDRCKLSSNDGIQSYRTDLQFYIPQLCNYLVFGCQFTKNKLVACMEAGSKMNFYFGHLYYFYIASLEKSVNEYEIQTFKKVSQYRKDFLHMICAHNKDISLNALQYYTGIQVGEDHISSEISEVITNYGTSKEQKIFPIQMSADKIKLPNYCSIFSETENNSFMSTINFFQDLFLISEDLKNFQDKKQKLKQDLNLINKKLPAAVYVPFSKDIVRLCNILKIVIDQSRIFSTKERAPFYICLEVFSPTEILDEEQDQIFWEKIQVPQTIRQVAFRESLKRSTRLSSNIRASNKKNLVMPNIYSNSVQAQSSRSSRCTTQLSKVLLEKSNPDMITNSSKHPINIEHKLRETLRGVFGQREDEIQERIKQNSIFGSLKTWGLVHLIVKTGDNLKQQQFALQLIYQFDYIFKLQKLPLLLTPYEVISMGPDCGIIEMVKQTVTLDKLKKFILSELPESPNLKTFFQIVYRDQLHTAKLNFTKSLAAYSLVMYLMQAKDRHNGNILLHESGKMLHIDFGFFLSNMPGKGLQIERDVPFKLLTEYIQVLDGEESYYFKKFRKYLFLGMKAVKKHQNKFLILVKMMYSSSGISMPCFDKGELAIRAFEERINPHNVTTDAALNIHCQKLINDSLDNTAAKWYDRWQYFAQGIFY